MMLMKIPVSWTRRRTVHVKAVPSSRRSTNLFILLVITLNLITSSTIVNSAPTRQSYTSTSMQTYLLKFGYLPQSGFEIRDQVSASRMKEAIKEFQAFGHLKVTGRLDKATRELMTKPRCGNPDILSEQFRGSRRRRRFIIQGQKWPNTSLTWSLVKSTPSQRDEDVIQELREALRLWSNSTPLTFTHITDRRGVNDADIRVNFQRGRHDDGYPFDGKGSILAHAFFPGTGQGGDAHFDDDEIWTVDSTPSREGTRLFAVAAHEFGHALGLSHSDVEGSLMYPWYQSFGYEFRLHRDDELGIQRIYGSTSKFAPNPHRPNKNDIPLRPSPTKRPPPRGDRPHSKPDGRPSTCGSSYDAISVIRKELFIFKGTYFWRLNGTQVLKGYPSKIRDMWRELPKTLTHVDAVYEHEHEIIFFIGKKYWRFGDGVNLTPGYPKSLASMGIKSSVRKIDGAMVWGHNGKTYLFSGSTYWRLREDASDFRIEPDYPRDMYVWKGVPKNIDAVLKWKDGNVYFFKGKVFWKFNDRYMRVEDERPTLSAPFWMGCTSHPLPSPTDEPKATANAVPRNVPTVIFHQSLLLPLTIPLVILAH